MKNVRDRASFFCVHLALVHTLLFLYCMFYCIADVTVADNTLPALFVILHRYYAKTARNATQCKTKWGRVKVTHT